ncbi:MAG: hypothetical protein CBE00_09830 [Planctomycetaceae bacterium TMED240]|nr:hypothetical protein [Rhodopirellula sp.]OUX05687.1 MAG: hypothetical protein CBE00_09830 [Planctomycetaceae bacterium TMED240]
MSATNIYDLLPIPEGVKEPHAYQVFGIEDGEQDLTIISDKIREVVGNLKRQKEGTNAKLWTQAAKLAQQARLTLANPKTKAKLDARFGIIADEPADTASSDPLASILPSADPLAGMLPAADPLVSTDPLAAILPTEPQSSATVASDTSSTAESKGSNEIPAGMFGTPTHETSGTTASLDSIPLVVPAQKTVGSPAGRKPRRRPKPILGLMIFGTFAIGMLSIIGILIWFMVNRGEVAITQSDGSLTISTAGKQATANKGENKEAPRGKATPERLEPDPVMGTLGPSKKTAGNTGGMTDLEKKMQDDDLTKSPDPEPDAPMADSNPKPPAVPEKPAITAEMVAEADKQLANVTMLIKSAKWDDMKAAAEKTSELPMNDEQKERAAALYEVADLASFYQGGIKKAVAEINVGNDFEVTKDFRVIVVEKGDDFIAIQFNARKKTYQFDELPFSLAHKLASFTIPASPTQTAAKSIYQSISPIANEESRKEALQWLSDLDDVRGADPKRISETLKQMF